MFSPGVVYEALICVLVIRALSIPQKHITHRSLSQSSTSSCSFKKISIEMSCILALGSFNCVTRPIAFFADENATSRSLEPKFAVLTASTALVLATAEATYAGSFISKHHKGRKV